MGLDVSANLTLGVLVTREDFFTKTGTKRFCSNCRKDRGPEKFCPDCGKPIGEAPTEVATAGFVNYAKNHGKSPEEMWEMLYESYSGLGIHLCGSTQDPEAKNSPIAFGFRVARGESHRRADAENIAATDLQEILIMSQTLVSHLTVLGLFDRRIQLFCGAYMSY